MINSYFDLYVRIKLPEDVQYKDLNSYLTALINRALLNDDELKANHEINKFKGYVFSSLHPIQKDKLYKKDQIYIFNINTLDFYTCNRLKDCLKQVDCIEFVDMRIHEFRVIDEIVTLTPCITSLKDGKYWTLKDSISYLYQNIDSNIKHKLCHFSDIQKGDIESKDNFIESIELRNTSNIVLNYKGGKLFAYNAIIKVKKDPTSQLLANLCIALGIGEKNSLGFGYCMSKKE